MASVNFSEEKAITIELANEEAIKTEVTDINYIPAYKTAELERQANEKERIAYYNEIQEKVANGEFNGKDGEKGDKGDKGEDGTLIFEELTEEQKASLKGEKGEDGKDGKSGVYVGSEEPTDNEINVWINPNGSPSEFTNESITPEKTTFMKKVSILNPEKCIVGYIPRGIGWNSDLTDDSKVSDSGIGFVTSECFECNGGEQFIHNGNTYNTSIYMADSTKAVIRTANIPKNTVWTVPDDVKYFRFVFTNNTSDMNNDQWKMKVKLIKGDTLDDTVLYGQNGVKNFEGDNQTLIIPKGKSFSEGEAIILLNFDGWNQHTFDVMAPYLKEKGIPFTLFFTGYNKGTGINPNDLKNYMQEMGKKFEFALYTGQPSSVTQGTTNFAEQFTQIKECYDGIVNYGLPRPKVCSYAGGSCTELTEYLCRDILGLKMGRSTVNSKIENEVTNAFTIPCSGYGDDGTWTISVVDSIVNNKQHRAVMTHNILSDAITDTSYNMRESYLKAWIDKIATAVNNGTLKAMTFSEYYLYTILPHTANIGQHAIVTENDNRQHEYVYTENGWVEITMYKNY